ncbi:MAG: Mrp/NBP35 family ATP-binding protein [Desulfobacteraceae bacterium]|nr:Mrp/NBP35 family ATP-binding protein [Desulfobacteraceae bacterium]
MVEIHENVQAAEVDADPKRRQEEAVKKSLEGIKHKFIIMSGKGGVGKTSTTVNLARALAHKKYKVGLIDADLHGPDVPRMLGLSGMPELNENRKLIPVRYSENLSVISVESLTEGKDDAIIWRGPLKYAALQQFIGEVAWGELDFLLIDAPPGTGDEPLTIAQTITDAKAIIVTTPQEVALADVRKSINFCTQVKLEVFGLIENMSGFTCPHCDCKVDLFGSGGGQQTAEAWGLHFLGKIPFDPQFVACGDTGVSYQSEYSDSAVSKAFGDISDRMSKLMA